MGTRSKYFRATGITLAQQQDRMTSRCPNFRVSSTRMSVSFTGSIQPSAMSATYQAKIEYTLGKRPKVWVLNPAPRKRLGSKKVPHTFRDGSVCLHLHGQWLPSQFICDTIIPWLALWLYHYESWQATGNWLGGGHEPDDFK
jgi:hypothetical protein